MLSGLPLPRGPEWDKPPEGKRAERPEREGERDQPPEGKRAGRPERGQIEWPSAFISEPQAAAVISDFDGTLAPIVADPAAARALPGAVSLLSGLAKRVAVVGVVSGRPLSFLVERLGLELGRAPAGLRLAGLYGLEEAGGDGERRIAPLAESFRAELDRLAEAARDQSPRGVMVEHKGLAVTLHWRVAGEPGARWAARFVEQQVKPAGLCAMAGRKSVELLPPGARDKGAVVRAWAGHCRAVAYLGDDTGDLPAFRALDELARAGATARKVAVAGPEVPEELVRAADVVVDGPEGGLALLARLRDALGVGG
jgi:trehalose 6-phosphate phosphatase